MNTQKKIEQCLRAVPKPPAPGGLLDKLQNNVAFAKSKQRVSVIRRWFAPKGGPILLWRVAAAAAIAIMVLLPLSYGATKLIKHFITISQLSAIKLDFPYRGALSPDGKHFAGITRQSQLVVIDISIGEQRNLGGDYYGPVVWSADGSEIAMASYGKEKAILVAVSLKTGKTRTLMEDPLWLHDWSPDGKRILGRRLPKPGVRPVVMVNLESKEETVLGEETGEWPSSRFSPNGEWVSYITKEASQSILHLRKIDGTSHVKYTDFPGEFIQPLWSPDGTHLVFTGRQKGINRAHKDLWALRVEGNRFVGAPFPVLPDVEQMEFYNWSQNGRLAYRTGFRLGGIFVLPVDSRTGKATGAPRQLVREGGLWQMKPCWSPDGKQIAALHQQKGVELGVELSFISASSGEKIRTLPLAEIEIAGRGMSWSPDGQLIAFCGGDTEKRTGVFLVAVKTGAVKLLVETRRPHVDPIWASDGKSIAYGYESNVYVVNVEDGKPLRITALPEERKPKEHFRRPVFAPDGRSVAYVAGRRILATTIDGRETREIFRLKNENLTFSGFDLSPDGRHVVFITSDTEIWCASTDGSEPFRIGDISDVGSKAQVGWPRWSPKGDAITFIVNCEEYQYWVMENFLPAEEAAGR